MHEHWAGFWEHIEDLRCTLLRSLVIVGIGFILILLFYQPIFRFLTSYTAEQTEEGLHKHKIQRIQIINQTTRHQLFALPPQASLVSPLSSLEKKGDHFYQLSPGQALIYDETMDSSLLIMGPIEGLVLVLKACFWLSLALTAPMWGWTWVQFILPGLKEKERAILRPFLLLSLICLGIGIAFAYCVTLPIANQSLLFFNSLIGKNAWTLRNYVDYVLLLCLGHAIAAELVLLLFILVHFRVLSAPLLVAKRRYMIVLAFVLGALLTPPDVLTQLLLAIPLIGLYEASIYYARWREHSASKFGTSSYCFMSNESE